MRRALGAVVGVLLVATVSCGCSSAKVVAPRPTTSSTAAPGPTDGPGVATTTATGATTVSTRIRSLKINGHAALEAGSGSTAAVLAHGASTHKEQWKPLMPVLARAGYFAVALDLGDDRAGAVQDAVAYVRSKGATTIVLMGSSAGAQDVLEAAAKGTYAAVVTFSAVSVHTTDEPVYAIASKDDTVADTVPIAKDIASGSGKGSATLVVPGGVHGVDMLTKHPDVATKVVTWLRATLGH